MRPEKQTNALSNIFGLKNYWKMMDTIFNGERMRSHLPTGPCPTVYGLVLLIGVWISLVILPSMWLKALSCPCDPTRTSLGNIATLNCWLVWKDNGITCSGFRKGRPIRLVPGHFFQFNLLSYTSTIEVGLQLVPTSPVNIKGAVLTCTWPCPFTLQVPGLAKGTFERGLSLSSYQCLVKILTKM